MRFDSRLLAQDCPAKLDQQHTFSPVGNGLGQIRSWFDPTCRLFPYSGGTAPDFHRIPLLSENQYSGKMLWKQGSCREKIPLEKEVTFLHLSNKLSEGYFNLQISNFHDTRYSYLTKYSI